MGLGAADWDIVPVVALFLTVTNNSFASRGRKCSSLAMQWIHEYMRRVKLFEVCTEK